MSCLRVPGAAEPIMSFNTRVLTFMIIFACFMCPIEGLEPAPMGTPQSYLMENWENLRSTDPLMDYPDDWHCVNCSNYYMEVYPDWCIIEVWVEGAPTTHVANYHFIDGVLHVHDDHWEIRYTLPDWRNMNLVLYECGEEMTLEPHDIYLNADTFRIV